MKKFFKILGVILGIFIVIIFFSYQFFFTKINFDKNIKDDQRIKNLDKKVFWNFGFEQINKPKKISTDFTIDGKPNDTINFTFHAYQSEKYRNIGQFQVHFSTGYNGINIFLYRLKNKFRTEIDEFSDNVVENENKKRYKIISEKLTLDKENYKKNDSVFGILEIQFEDLVNNSKTNSISYFRAKME
ncbi:hypothetical protein [Elizabethkingia sp. JS20170427COW]|uniref:hypothetical protein n=1 Tax=Elizabethkingia sp. JS20170427COW TaxID=2583851 RepID=UPI001110A69E|nr:hypothetical protein [Elizabethkingia sp. JS20170427COW]QCX54345.1 hypothetical protein FGE20_11645 [Elizabethkingia sp. JS20170427COW]